MKLVGFGNLEIDYFFKNDINIGYSVGGVSLNTLINLSNEYTCNYYYNGEEYIDYNNYYNMSFIKLNNNINKKIYIFDNQFSSICPMCNRLSKFEYKTLDLNTIINNIDLDDHIIIDNLNEDNMNIVNNLSNSKYLIINYISIIDNLDIDDLYNLKNKFKLISISNKVYEYLRSKFKIDYYDLYEILECELLIIFNRKNNIIIFNNNIYEKEYEINNCIDYSGDIEIFTSFFIKLFINNIEINDKTISDTYIKAMNKYLFNSSLIGNTVLIKPLIKIDAYNQCICNK